MNTMNRYKYLIIILFLFPGIKGFSQRVTNVDPVPLLDKVLIRYKISGAKLYQKFDVALYVSQDGGQTFQGPMSSVTGDVGENVKPGKNHLTWDVFKDMNKLEGQVVFDVRAEVHGEKPRKRIFVNPSSTLIQTYGIKAGMIGRVGWYLGATYNSGRKLSPEFTSDDYFVKDYNTSGYYKFDEEVNHSVFTATAGLNFQLGRNLFWYAGAGYGEFELIWHIDQYDYFTDELVSDSYVVNDQRSYYGIVAESGMQIKMGFFLLSGGVTFYELDYYDYNIGIGVAF